GLSGRLGLAAPGRRPGRDRLRDEAGTAAVSGGGRVRHRGGLVAAPDPELQDDRPADLLDRTAPSPLPVPGPARIEDHAALLDRRRGAGGVEPGAAEGEVTS